MGRGPRPRLSPPGAAAGDVPGSAPARTSGRRRSPTRRSSLAAHVRELGFDVLEVCIEEPECVTAGAIRTAAAEASVAVSVCGAFGPDRDVSHDDAAMRRLGVEYLKACVDLAAAVGSPHVAGPMYAATGKTRLLPEPERERQRRWAADGLREAAAYAGERSVALAIEPLNRFETSFINLLAVDRPVVDRVNHADLELMLDTFHMNIEEQLAPASDPRGGGPAGAVHGCENDRGAPGSGHVDWRGVADALAETGYESQVVIESFTPGIEQIARAASVWRPLGDSPDAIAADGLAFLRDLLSVPVGAAR